MLNTKLITWSAGIFGAFSFVVCVGFGLITPESVHMHQFLELVLPAFTWISFSAFLLGVVESFLWGVYLGLGYTLIYNLLYRLWWSSDKA